MENFLEHQIRLDEYITGNRLIQACEGSKAIFCKTDYLKDFCQNDIQTFVTHNSDYPINEQRYVKGPKCDKWYAQNKDVEKDNVFSLPIGLENMKLYVSPLSKDGKYSSEVDRAFEKAILIDKLNSLMLDKNNFAYMNFNINTYASERGKVWNKFKEEQWVTTANNVTLYKFYYDLATHKFAFSPRGNGIDCHRTWEALYLRTVPIVKESIHMNSFRDLPIYFIKNWDEVCYDRLKSFYEERIVQEDFSLEKMKISYWNEQFKS